jgi:hypothetical protein
MGKRLQAASTAIEWPAIPTIEKYYDSWMSIEAELGLLAQANPSTAPIIERIKEDLSAMESFPSQLLGAIEPLVKQARARSIRDFESGMAYQSYPSSGTVADKAIWDTLLKYGEGLLPKTLCDELANDDIRVPEHLRNDPREDWWHAFQRSHNVRQYISTQRIAFGRWARANTFYNEHVAPSRKTK